MQNKGFVKVFAVLLTLVCIFYLSFSFVTRYYTNKAEAMGPTAGKAYLDSIKNEKVYLGAYTFKQCQEMEIGLGLDLKGGMNVILEVSVPDVIKTLADHSEDPTFNKALSDAAAEAENSQSDVLSLFVRNYQKAKGNNHLAEIFATQQLKGQVTTSSNDAAIEKVLRSEIKAAIDNSYTVLRSRIDRFGVAQPNIQNLEGQMGRIMVELPGIKEPERVRKLLQGSANLEFWETYDTQVALPYLQTLDSRLAAAGKGTADSLKTAADSSKATAANAAAKANGKIDAAAVLAQNAGSAAKKGAAASTSAAEAKLRAEHPLFSIMQPAQGNAGCLVGYVLAKDTAQVDRLLASPEAKEVLPKDLTLKWGVKPSEVSSKAEIFELYAIRITERNGRAPLEGDVVVTAKDDYDQFGRPDVSMTMNSDGARRWAALTKKNKDHAIAIVLDGYVYSAPNVENEITGGVSSITGHFTAEDTKDLANVLKSGKMPAPAHIVQEDIVGPSLGQESINQGFTSCVVAFILLMIYMCMIYGWIPGMVANCALILNFFFTFGVLTSFQAALTMSGIAGMVLTLGMAVDANVLIYERTKEELARGLNVKNALSEGYSHAFSAIFDSNLTSIITGIILFYFGTGPIRGFATTLIIGLCASFFTAVWVTRLVYEHQLNRERWTNLTFVTRYSAHLMRDPRYHFMSAYKVSFVVFGIALVLSLGSFAVRGLSQGIDFTGGRNYVVQFEKQVQPEQAEALLQSEIGDQGNVSAIALGTDERTLRITTNYLINDNSQAVDSKVEKTLYDALYKGKLLAKDVTFSRFIDRDNRAGGSIISSQKVGPSIAKDITYGAIESVLLALVAIFLYILLRFRNVAFSIGSTLALAVDALLIIGTYSLCWGWMPFSLEIDQTFIGAVLTAIGYSINDKVVVFDRIRENLKKFPKRDLQQQFNDSLNQTLARTINTSLTTLIVLLCIFFLGGTSIRSFAFAMILGVVYGTCSSLFLAAPIAYLVLGKRIKNNNADVVAEDKPQPVKA